MKLTPELKAQIERLYENESLTDNLDDAAARAVLKWAEEQIRGRADPGLVTAAVSAANQSGEQGARALVAHAGTFLTQELRAGAATTSSPPDASTDAARGESAEAGGMSPSPEPSVLSAQAPPPSAEAGTAAAPAPAPEFGTGGQAGSSTLDASAGSGVAPDAGLTGQTPARPQRRSARRRKSR